MVELALAALIAFSAMMAAFACLLTHHSAMHYQKEYLDLKERVRRHNEKKFFLHPEETEKLIDELLDHSSENCEIKIVENFEMPVTIQVQKVQDD